jgi:5-methyltetrahydropteroyltriglutamate--homocysteine methyltransferase
MQRSTHRILTTHVGSLPGPKETAPGASASDRRHEAVAFVVELQKSAGIDLVNEGELTKEGSWVSFMGPRLTGFERTTRTSSLFNDPDFAEFKDFYSAAMARGTLFEQTGTVHPVNADEAYLQACRGPIKYVGQAALRVEIDALKAALGNKPVAEAFLTTVAPASYEPQHLNEYYESQEAYLYALADAMAVEYETIAAEGLAVQVDDAYLAALWTTLGIKMGLEAYRSYCKLRVEALNHALRNIPVEQIRYHVCWGSWHGPHAYDLPLKDIVDIVLGVKAGAYLIEAANARHEHEYHVWESVKLPAGRVLMPGVVSHATPLIEHPELVSERIQRFARLLGKENVIASTDCGLGSRCHPQIAAAKLKALSAGAALASKALY